MSVTYTDLLSEVSAFLGYGSDHTALDGARLAEVDRYVQSGVRQFYYPPAVGDLVGHEWSFLTPTATIDTVAEHKDQDLPNDLVRITGDMFFEDAPMIPALSIVSEGRVMALRQQQHPSARPKCAAVVHKPSDGSNTQKLQIKWWPTPDKVYGISYVYEAYSGPLTTAKPHPLGGQKHAELIIESCLSVAEQRANDERGAHWERFSALLIAGVIQDQKVGARYFGDMGNPTEIHSLPRRAHQQSYPVSYKGDTW